VGCDSKGRNYHLYSYRAAVSRIAERDLERMETCVSSQKGMARCTNGTERVLIMPRYKDITREYLKRRWITTTVIGWSDVETLFLFILVNEEARFWPTAASPKLKKSAETTSEQHLDGETLSPRMLRH